MTIKVSAVGPEIRFLSKADPSEKTWVKIKPPSWEEEKRRANLLSNRKYYYDDLGRLITEVDCNIMELWEVEIWLTYLGSNRLSGDQSPSSLFQFVPNQTSARLDCVNRLRSGLDDV